MSKVVLVTGANKGIGFEVSRQLAKAGATVLLGARNEALGTAAAAKLRSDGLDVRFVKVDLNSAVESGVALAGQIANEFGRLDALVNNAGIVDPGDGLPSAVTAEALRKVFETNFFGVVLFTQPLIPLLRAADTASVVNVSSGLGSMKTNSDPQDPFYHAKLLAYNASKAALNMFTLNLAYELRETKVKVNSVSPGYVATDMTDHKGVMTVEQGAVEIVRLAQLSAEGPTGGFFSLEGTYPW